MDEPRLTELDIELVTITRDGDGLITVDGGGLHDEAVSHLLLMGQYVHAADLFDPPIKDDNDYGED